MNRTTHALHLILLAGGMSTPQYAQSVPRDTSFTVSSAAEKLKKQFPHARAVVPSHPAAVTVRKGLAYVQRGDRELKLDLFLPRAGSPVPAIVMIFGGGWRSGDRSMNEPMAEQFALGGFAAASIDYRLSTEAQFPAAVHDVKAAVRWLRRCGASYGIDTNRIAVIGFSAGGELAAFTGATNGDPRYEGKGNDGYASTVQGVIDMDGVLDFTTPDEAGKDTIPGKLSAAAMFLGATYKENPALWVEASPLTHAGRTTPPLLFVNSALPRYHYGREAMIERVNGFGTYTEVRTIPDTPHPFWLFHPWFGPACEYSLAFLNRILMPKRYTIDNCVNVFDPAKVESTKAGYQYWFADRNFIDGRTLKMSVVAPHAATHPPHAHPEDEFFFVLEGTAEFFLDGAVKQAGPYTSFYCPPNVPHGIRNAGATVLKYLVVKKY